MAECDQEKLVPSQIEFVDHAIIPHPQSELRTPLQPNVRKLFQLGTQVMNTALNALAYVRRKPEENCVELAGIDLSRLVH